MQHSPKEYWPVFINNKLFTKNLQQFDVPFLRKITSPKYLLHILYIFQSDLWRRGKKLIFCKAPEYLWDNLTGRPAPFSKVLERWINKQKKVSEKLCGLGFSYLKFWMVWGWQPRLYSLKRNKFPNWKIESFHFYASSYITLRVKNHRQPDNHKNSRFCSRKKTAFLLSVLGQKSTISSIV